MINYDLFYRKYGIRDITQLIKPRFFPSVNLELPFNSIYHYIDYEGITNGPLNDDLLFLKVTKPIQVDHVTSLVTAIGSPRPNVISTISEINEYHIQNKKTRKIRPEAAEVLKDINTLIVYNYSFLSKLYKYNNSQFKDYYKWYNIFNTVIETISNLDNNRNNFILVNVPKVIPPLSKLELATEKDINISLLNTFINKDSYLLLEIWKFLSKDHSDKSLFSKIPKEKLHLLNLIYLENNNFIVLNMGLLLSFSEESDKYNLFIKSRTRIKSSMLQRRFLVGNISIQELNNINSDIEISEDSDNLLQDIQVPESPEEIDDAKKQEEEFINKKILEIQEFETIDKADNEPVISTDALANKDKPLETNNLDIAKALSEVGKISNSEFVKLNKIINEYKNIKVPGKDISIVEYSKISKEELLINRDKPNISDKKSVLDKSMLHSSLIDFDSTYVEKILPKDIFNMVLNCMNAGIAITDYKIEKQEDLLNGYEIHNVKIHPMVGKPSTISMMLPIVDKNGIFKSNNTKYRIRKQKSDLPIRKIFENKVALTSYYGKTFVTRGRKKINDYGNWLVSNILSIGLDNSNSFISDLLSSDVFYSDTILPRAYTAISTKIRELTCRGFKLNFDYLQREKLYDNNILKKYEKNHSVIFGKNNKNEYLLLDKNNILYLINDKDEIKEFYSIEDFFNLDKTKIPIEYAEVDIFGKSIPVGFILAYFLGFDNLLKLLKVKPKRITDNSKISLEPDEWKIRFNDETLIFNKDDTLVTLILGGFNAYYKSIKNYKADSYNRKNVYLAIAQENQLSIRYLREIDLMNKLFIDPITKDILIEMKEPITFQGLLIRASELLMYDQHPDQLDPSFMRIKGYERISGAVYTEMVKGIREHESRLNKEAFSITLNPFAVWKRIAEDPSKMIVNEINPIESLKELEAVTFSGTGGRSRRSMVKNTRIYHENDLGTISEATVDSSDVGINTFTSADPLFNSLRGLSNKHAINKNNYTNLFSTSMLNAPGSDRDDPKRVGFVSIQNSHTLSCSGYHQSTIKTGYDSVIADRTYELFAHIAKKDGKVISLNEKGIIIEYMDGEKIGYEIGRRFGSAAGLIIPHFIITPLKINDEVKTGDVVIYNSDYFEPDFFDKRKICLKFNTNINVVLWESHQTLEDASSISKRVTNLLNTKTTKVKTIIAAFDQSISRILPVGTEVSVDDVLCFIENPSSANNSLFDKTSIDILRTLSSQTPKAGTKGIIEKIEFFYYGSKEDMSESLRQLADNEDKRLKQEAKSLNRPIYSAEVDSSLRIDNEPLSMDHVAIKFYITSNNDTGLGDKGVFVNQMKTVFSEVLEDDIISEEGVVIDAIFGGQSINDRIVNSPIIIGTTNMLLKIIADKAIDL